jgi:hypothetical protein
MAKHRKQTSRNKTARRAEPLEQAKKFGFLGFLKVLASIVSFLSSAYLAYEIFYASIPNIEAEAVPMGALGGPLKNPFKITNSSSLFRMYNEITFCIPDYDIDKRPRMSGFALTNDEPKTISPGESVWFQCPIRIGDQRFTRALLAVRVTYTTYVLHLFWWHRDYLKWFTLLRDATGHPYWLEGRGNF